MSRFKSFLRVVTLGVLIGFISVSLLAIVESVRSARSSAAEVRKIAAEAKADLRNVTVTITVTGNDAASRATAEKIVRNIQFMGHDAPATESYSVPMTARR